MNGMKYKLVRGGRRKPHHESGLTFRYFRLQSLRDIPEHGVKAGDLGGFITKDVHLSHYGSCWIGEEAHVIGNVQVKDDAYIGARATVSCKMPDSEIIVSGKAKIFGKAQVITYTTEKRADPKMVTEIKDNAKISGNSQCFNMVEVSGNSQIQDKAIIGFNSSVIGASKISGSSNVHSDSLIVDSVLSDNSVVGKHCNLTESIVSGISIVKDQSILLQTELTGNAIVPLGERLVKGKVDKSGIKPAGDSLTMHIDPDDPFEVYTEPSAPKHEAGPTAIPLSQESVALLTEVKDSIASYETDIVKIIKYPAMVDKSIPETLAMNVALKKAIRLSSAPSSKSFQTAVETLEEKFMVAESNALKMASTLLSEEQLKKTQKAKDLLRIATNEASTENEKKVAFVQGFKQLEGIIAVPEIAVDTFRVKIGLQEIEA